MASKEETRAIHERIRPILPGDGPGTISDVVNALVAHHRSQNASEYEDDLEDDYPIASDSAKGRGNQTGSGVI